MFFKGTVLGIFISLTVVNALPQQQRQFNDIRDNTIDINGQRNNGRRNYQRNEVIGDEISQKFLSFDVPETVDAYQPGLNQKAAVPIDLGERRCGNYYRGGILPCLLRPQLPPFSYSTERGYNMEYKKK